MTISVIIPTLNEADTIGETIRSLRAQQPCEILVVDGGSGDGTLVAARQADQVLQSPRGRAAQMNAGAARASGDTLLFLHADCTLEPGALDGAVSILARRSVVAGCYTMSVRGSGWLFRAIDVCATGRVRLTGLAYGDQGLFVRRSKFERLGGFPAVPFLEDVYMSDLLRRHGRIVVSRRRIFVSPRRWRRIGLVRQTLRNWTLTALAAAGIPPHQLATYYPPVR
jgi:rSAM/selenodomain-associated transferase 2